HTIVHQVRPMARGRSQTTEMVCGGRRRRRTGARAPLVAVLLACLLPACAGPPLDTRDVVLSYEENPSWCNNCPVFAFDVSAPGAVSFRCRRGCAVPG